jgi:hypothetical protein
MSRTVLVIFALIAALVPSIATAGAANASAASVVDVPIALANYPVGGPVFAGPQVQPWVCGTQAVGLGPATDSQCNAPTQFSYYYKTPLGVFLAYDPANPPLPALIASTTTDQGITVPYVVRMETGTQDRGIYQLAVLVYPRQPETAVWNHKLVAAFDGGAAPHHSQDPPPHNLAGVPAGAMVLDDMSLSRGFMVATSGLLVHASNVNQVVSAEALMMLKEHIAEQYGRIRYTIGTGCSGGSIQQYMIAAAYPGLLDGIQPNCGYPDLWTTATESLDCHLLDHYFSGSPLTFPSGTQRAAVDGHHDDSDCANWDLSFGSIDDPAVAGNCNLPVNQVYNATTNPDGVRCSVQDYQAAIWGMRTQDGFAKRPLDNVGVQYGLDALKSGTITPAQFVDLNTKVGGLDINQGFQAARHEADPGATAIAYRTSQVADARQWATVPIVDLRGYSESGQIHTSFHSYQVRAKLDRDNGRHDNQLIWTFPATLGLLLNPPPDIALKSFLLIDQWLSRIEHDSSGASLADKVIADKPAAALDSCWINGAQETDMNVCAATYPHYGDARTAAGEAVTDDALKCQLKPLNRTEYGAAFTDAQWTQLRTTFPAGVCDWSRPGVDQRASVPWLSFAAGPGGQPLSNPPTSSMP